MTQQETSDTTGSLGFTATLTTTPARTWSYTYDTQGRLLTENGPRTDVSDITTYTYYSTSLPGFYQSGDLWKITNALGHVTVFNKYDANGRVLDILMADNTPVSLTYNLRGWLVKNDKAGSYDYYDTGLLKKFTSNDNREYTYEYDTAHRLISITSKTGEKATFTPDAAGNVTRVVLDKYGTIATEFDQRFNALGQVYETIQKIQGNPATTQYTYDAAGNVQNVLTPSLYSTTHQYDALNRLQTTQQALNLPSATTLTTGQTYNAQNVAKTTTAPNLAATTNTVINVLVR